MREILTSYRFPFSISGADTKRDTSAAAGTFEKLKTIQNRAVTNAHAVSFTDDRFVNYGIVSQRSENPSFQKHKLRRAFAVGG